MTTKRSTWNIELIARGVLLAGSRVLLCQNTKRGYFYLPGGHVEFFESAAAALSREFLEETGLKVKVGSLLLVSEGSFETAKRPHHEVNLVFELVGPPKRVIRSREKGIAFTWVELAAVAAMDVRPVSARDWLASRTGSVDEAKAEWISEMV